MSSSKEAISQALARYQLPEFKPAWGAIRRGIEKESLRVSSAGHISRHKHPVALGSTLSNPCITTDFAEALLEFITPPNASIEDCLAMLDNIHRFTLQNMEHDEVLWNSSMPCQIDADTPIRIAEYGSSNIGRLKNLYRKGLHHRYGSVMQVVAGLHYNFSMPDAFWSDYQHIRATQHKDSATDTPQQFQTNQYLHLIRNFHRRSWLLLYLFGASPATCKSFTGGRQHSLDEFDDTTLYKPDATCLRMSNLGYQSTAQKTLFVCYNELETYIECLYQAMNMPYAEYEAIGQQRDGEFFQINTALLQLENEFYGTIRPKRTVKSGERPLDGLQQQGIEYIELRALDLNPYLALGIDAEQVRFLDTFLLHCLLGESPECNPQEFFEVADNLAKVVENGRNLNLELHKEGKPVKLGEWAGNILGELAPSATLLDHIHGGQAYSKALAQQQAKLADPALTPSARILQEMRDDKLSFFQFAMRHSQRSSDQFLNNKLAPDAQAMLQQAATDSLAKQAAVEAADTLDFAEFLAQWNVAGAVNPVHNTE
ncbi:MAG: glutamate--cysteine ligase [Pseudohongiellaceae bacterium]